jgi:hypothetical protein
LLTGLDISYSNIFLAARMINLLTNWKPRTYVDGPAILLSIRKRELWAIESMLLFWTCGLRNLSSVAKLLVLLLILR